MAHKIYGQNVLVINNESAPEPTGNYIVRVIDYDGTVLMTKKGNSGDVISLPDPPSHDKLTFQEWNATDTVSNNSVTISDSDINVGAIYTTTSGLNEFDITLTKVTGLDVTINMNGTKDWGDGTSDTETTHTYTSYGNYTITCDGTTITSTSSAGLFGQTASVANYYLISVRLSSVNLITVYSFQNCRNLEKINIPLEVTDIGGSAFKSCISLTNVIIPDSVTSIGGSAFYRCTSLTSVNIPDSVTSIGYSVFYSCTSLTSIVIPDSVTSIGDGAFTLCTSLTSIVIPDSVTSIGSSAFDSCNSLTSITIGNGVTSIGSSAFYGCWVLLYYNFSNSTAVPTLTTVNAFTDINALAKIIVSDVLYDEWIAATNWSTYADYIYKVSEVTE